MFVFMRRRKPAQDDGFVESKHPRKPAGQEGGGQFTAGAGGGSSSGGAGSTAAGKYIVNSHVGLVLKKYNYVKGKDTDGNLTFYGPNGHKVIIHPPDIGKKSSSAWSLYKPDQSVIKKAGIQLENYLAKAHTYKPAGVLFAVLALQHGFQAKPTAPDGTTQLEHPANGIMLTISSHGWMLQGPNLGKIGDTPAGLAEVLKQTFEHTAHPNEEHASAFNSSMAKLGYGKLKEDESTATYKKTAGGKVSNITYIKIGPKADTWTCETQGHMTKQGSGVNALEQLLMHGKIAPGVTNVTAPSVPNAATVTPKEHVQLWKKLQAASKAPVGSQYQHVENYKGSGYHHINDCLRFKDNCADPAVPKIEAWLNDNALPEDVTLWRGVKGEYAKVLKSIVMVGTKFKDRGFVSTSTSNEFSKSWGSGGGLLMKIKAKKGLKGATISQNYVDSEYEVLLQRNTHFHVTAYDPKTGILEVEALQEE